MAWDKKNTRQLLTWAYLYTDHEIFVGFIKSEKIKMKKLPFWNHAIAVNRKVTARPLAVGLHELIAAEDGARYEDSETTYFSAVTKLVGTFVDGDKTIKDLSDKVELWLIK